MLNFKKDTIFSRNTDITQKHEDLSSGGVLAVWGSPGSGKSTVAAKIAKALADSKRDTILVLCDMTAPMITTICPPSELDCEKSLGSVLAAVHVNESLIKNNLITFKHSRNLAMICMLKGENEYTYPTYTSSQATELIRCLRNIAPYVVIDCGSYIANDILSSITLLEADSVLRLANCDLKSVSYLSSQLPLLKGQKWDSDRQYKVASRVIPSQNSDYIDQSFGGLAFKLPYSQELAQQYRDGNLLAELCMKDSLGFRKGIKKITKEVF